jgi:phospholipid/cholesterol/gamma-HCH transport system permease protein
LEYSAGAWRLLTRAVSRLTALKIASVRTVLYRQVYFTGFEALDTVALIGGLIGIVIVTQVASLAGLNPSLTGKVLMWVVVRELGPLFTAILVIARSCSAVASELGTMQIRNEVRNLRVMGVDPYGYLVVPRVLGLTAGVVILSAYFQLFAIAGGVVVSSLLFVDIPIAEHLGGIFNELAFFDIGVSFVKSVAFGLVISTVSCYHGFRARGSATEIPRVTAAAVMHSLLLLFVWDGAITVAFFL